MTNLAHNVPLSDGLHQEFANAQAKADRIAQAFGDSAPRWLDGERLPDYRRRLVSQFKEHSPTWKSADVPRDEGVLRIAEAQIYADAAREASNPTTLGPGELVERTIIDQAGRRISRFHGDPGVWMDAFKYPTQQVIGYPGGRR